MQTQVAEVKVTIGQGGAAPAADQNRTPDFEQGLARRLGKHAHGHAWARELLQVAVEHDLLTNDQLNAPVDRLR